MIVAFASGKGGVGKTTLAINVVIARSMAGKDVLLVDGDTRDPLPTSRHCGSKFSEKTATP